MLSSLCFVVLLFFFFKQKTAYEMRISDWSSDVCSSDLGIATGLSPGCECIRVPATAQRLVEIDQGERGVGGAGIEAGLAGEDAALRGQDIQVVGSAFLIRSEEHTSELQSLMRISYAVFCLKKNIKTTKHVKNIISKSTIQE